MLSIVIPCYNEGEKLKENITKIQNYINEKLKIDYEIICVNDGSTDNTEEILNGVKNIKQISYVKNRGKGYAVKIGIQNASGDKIVFMDADLSTDLNALSKALKSESDIVIGNRNDVNSDVEGKSAIRKLSSFVSNTIIRVITGMNYKDTQCGFKMFKKDASRTLTEKQTVDRWAFDVEYLYIAKLNHLSVSTIPVKWENDSDSRVSLVKDSISFFKEVLKIRGNKKKYL